MPKKAEFAGIFTADAYVIEAQDDHVVMAVRVPRDTVQRNIHFLAAVADHIPTNAQPAVFIPRPYRNRPRRAKIAAGAIAVVCAAIGGFWLVDLRAATEPPVINYSITIANPVLAPGEPLLIAFTTKRSRLCKMDVDRVIINSAGETVFAARQHGIGQAITKEPISRVFRLPLPDGLGTGHYIYRSTMFSDCGGADTHVRNNPPLAFEIR